MGLDDYGAIVLCLLALKNRDIWRRLLIATSCTTNLTFSHPRLKPRTRGEKPASNRLPWKQEIYKRKICLVYHRGT
jgi:hypothetical protein